MFWLVNNFIRMQLVNSSWSRYWWYSVDTAVLRTRSLLPSALGIPSCMASPGVPPGRHCNWDTHPCSRTVFTSSVESSWNSCWLSLSGDPLRQLFLQNNRFCRCVWFVVRISCLTCSRVPKECQQWTSLFLRWFKALRVLPHEAHKTRQRSANYTLQRRDTCNTREKPTSAKGRHSCLRRKSGLKKGKLKPSTHTFDRATAHPICHMKRTRLQMHQSSSPGLILDWKQPCDAIHFEHTSCRSNQQYVVCSHNPR